MVSRRWAPVLCVLATAAWVAAGSSLAEDAPSKSRLKVLVVTGGHGYNQAEFEAMFRADEGLECHFQDHQREPKPQETIASPEIRAYDAILLYDMWQPISDAHKQAFADVVRRGKGLVVLHHAMANYQEWPEYREMFGGRYFFSKRVEDGVEKPGSTYRHDVDLKVEIADPDHYVTRGLSDFEIHDEVYNHFAVDPGTHVLLKTNHPESGPVVGWTKPYGKGRVACIQLGHDERAFRDSPQFRQLVSRAIRFVARQTPDDLAAVSLLDGEGLSGWEATGNARFGREDGILLGRQGPGGSAGDLFTVRDYGDFECEVHWAMDWPGNSGVWFRYVDGQKAYQADILEWKSPVCWSGSLYCGGKMFIAMNEDPAIIDREGWNVFRIRAVKDHIVVHLNGRQVADVRDDSSARGKFGIQVHAGEAFAKMAIKIADIRVRELR